METTITISIETKKLLEKLKGRETWDSFLRRMALEELKKRREVNRKKLAELLVEETGRAKWAREF
jgi:predicted CopG family antitoxin